MPVDTASDVSPSVADQDPAGRPRRPVGGRLLELGKSFLTLREGSVIVITIGVAVYFSATSDAFLTWDNFKTLLPYFAPVAILAAGQVFLMINGEIDLSIGAVYLFAPFMFHEFYDASIPLVLAFVLAMLACAVVGLFNGFATTVIGINSFITTLGTLLALEGVTLIISHAEPVVCSWSARITAATFRGQMRLFPVARQPSQDHTCSVEGCTCEGFERRMNGGGAAAA